MPKQNKSEFRLPGDAVPSGYDITLRPDLEEFSFTGEETITVMVKEPVNSIKINSAEIVFGEVYVENESGTRLLGDVTLNEETELANIQFNGILGVGVWKLHIKFSGILSEQLRGFYRSSWTDEQGGNHVLASTHFEPTHARRAFPCFDEPEYKATFKIALEVREDLNVISNEVVSKVTKPTGDGASSGIKRVEFRETMKVSTYLVAFCVGDFVSSEPVNVNGTEIRIWCTPGKEHLTAFASKAACFAVDFYERYFEIDYPGSKIDHIAIPDFPIGAMENLGCITFREKALLVDGEKASHLSLVSVANIVMHELAHMWFGDLVTMRWWNGLWLKESFATFMANVCLDAWRPEWKVWNDFAHSRSQALATDALRSTHAIENPVNHPDEASEMFDIISYEKGCSVLYQLHEFLGAELFRKGCVSYLKEHQYGNTETHDLWEALERVCREENNDTEVRSIMDAWVFSEGHPVVHIEEGTKDNTVIVSQRKFQLLPEGADWKLPVPISLRIERADGSSELRKFVLNDQSETIDLGTGYEAIVVNAGGSGCYRVTYSKGLLDRLFANGIDELDVVERYNLLNDSWSMVRSGSMTAQDYLALVKNFSEEEDSNIWELILVYLSRLHRIVAEDQRDDLKSFISTLVEPQVAKLGWTARSTDSIAERKIRALVYEKLGTVCGKQSVIEQCREAFDNLGSLDVEMVSTVVYVIAYNGDEEDFQEYIERSKNATTPQDEVLYLFALASFRKPELLSLACKMCLSSEVRSQNAPFLFAAIVRNEIGGSEAWQFFKSRMQDMQRLYASTAMARLCASFASLDMPDQETDVVKFFESNKVKAGDTAIKQMLEQLRVNVELRMREAQSLVAITV